MLRLARLLVRVFFRQVQVEHGRRLRPGVPTVLVADHRNGLVDGLVLMAALDRFPRFLGKSTLFANPLLWPFLTLAGVVPVYRPADGGPTSRNVESFGAAARLLGQGGLVAIFPEGISHDEPGLQPLRTGAARIALGAVGDGVTGVETVAVSLLYDEKQRFRSRVLVRVGCPQPVEAGPRTQLSSDDNRAAVRLLTDDLAARLRSLGPAVIDSAEADLVTECAEVAARSDGPSCRPVSLAERERMRHALLLAGEVAGQVVAPTNGLDALRSAVASYRWARERCDLTDAQIASVASASQGSARFRSSLAVAVAVAEVLVLLPAVAIGILVHALPYLVVKQASRMPRNEGIRATVKIVGNLVLFFLVYLTLGVVLGVVFGAPVGVAVTLVAPLCGYVTVVAAERLCGIVDTIRVNHFARRRGLDFAELAGLRTRVLAAATALGISPADVSGP